MTSTKGKAIAWAFLAGAIVFIVLAFLPLGFSSDEELDSMTVVMIIASLAVAIPVYFIKK